MQEKLCFVQFMHPGGEHSADSDGFKDWNRAPRPHKRKFVEIDGRCQRNKKSYEGPLRFWTEWEPQSEVIERIEEPVPYGPKLICKPFFNVPKTYENLQNTDPFVFDGFYYTLCQQRIKEFKFPTQLRHLERGSVILFGSRVGGKFALDTVFVVDTWVDHDSSNYAKLKRRVPKGYWDVTMSAWYKDGDASCGSGGVPANREASHRLYFGATVDNPVEGMFSFFPCRPANRCPNGFARPVIRLQAVITDNLAQSRRHNPGLRPDQVKNLWNEVRNQVKSAGLWLGVKAEMPERRRLVANPR